MTLRTVSRTLAEGLLVVLLVLVFFLGSLRAALLTAITIPLSLLFAFICMHLSGIPANLLSLGAIDFGIIVDGSLVMVEHILHTVRGRRGAAAAGPWIVEAVRDAALEMERPIFYSMVIIIARLFSRCSRCNASSGSCSRRWHSPSPLRCWDRLLIALTVVPVLASLYLPGWRQEPGTIRCSAGSEGAPPPPAGEIAVRPAAGRCPRRLRPSASPEPELLRCVLGVEFLPVLDEGLAIWCRRQPAGGHLLEKSAGVACRHPETRACCTPRGFARPALQTGRN